MCATSRDPSLRSPISRGAPTMSSRNTGPSSVPMMNQRERTRSRYSRLKTTNSLPMTAHSLLDPARADALEEDLVQRRQNELEPRDRHAGVDHATQHLLRVGAWRELQLVISIVVIDPRDQRPIAEHRRDPVARV